MRQQNRTSTSDGEDYEASSLRCLIANIQLRHLKKNDYRPVSIINDKKIKLARKILHSVKKKKKNRES